MTKTALGRKILCVVGARPNFMKIAPVMAALSRPGTGMSARLVHTGQHYDEAMNEQFFRELDIPLPDINLEVGSGSHAVQTAEIMKRFEPVMEQENPDAVLVVGDVNSTIACALVSVKRGVPVIHVEAGLRSFDRTMPEEINRVLTDQISSLLFTTERCAEANLEREGISRDAVHFVGNVMIDTLHHNLGRAVPAMQTLSTAQWAGESGSIREYGILTLHRPSNVDDRMVLKGLLGAVKTMSQRVPFVFPLHPRTRARIEEFGLSSLLSEGRILLLPPVGYLQMLGLMKDARIVLTDSGGIQEETTALGVPCVTLRENTERPVTIEEGTNTLAGQDPARILSIFEDVMNNGGKSGRIPEFWDGKASHRIVATLAEWFERPGEQRVA